MKKIAKKLDEDLWESAKAEAVARMGGVFSARAMQLATSIYKRAGGRYEGPKTGQEGLSEWTRQRWMTRPGTPQKAKRGKTTARYLPAAAWASMSKQERVATDAKKRRACKGKKKCYVPNTAKAKKASRRARNEAMGNRLSNQASRGCPPAFQSMEVNSQNRSRAILLAQYGTKGPRGQACINCVYYDEQLGRSCLPKGYEAGYCEKFDFVAAPNAWCKAWKPE